MSWTTLYLGSLRNATDHVWIMLRICSFTGSGLDWNKKVQYQVASHITPIVISWLFINYLFINLLHVHPHFKSLAILANWLALRRVIYSQFICIFMELNFVSVHKCKKKELGQYTTILTSCFVNNVNVLVNILISDNFCFVFFVFGYMKLKQKKNKN